MPANTISPNQDFTFFHNQYPPELYFFASVKIFAPENFQRLWNLKIRLLSDMLG